MPGRTRTAALLALLATIFLGCTCNAPTTPAAKDAGAPPVVAAKDEPVIEVMPAVLDRAILDNPIDADRKYLGKRHRLPGRTVEEIGSDRNGYFVLTDCGETLRPAADQLDAFSKLRPGNKFSAEGTLTSYRQANVGWVIRTVYEQVKLIPAGPGQ